MNSTSDNSCNNKESGTSKSKSDDGVCDVNDRLNNMSTADNGDVSVCANCGKEGEEINNICNKCSQVRYCNAVCKKKHKKKHKKHCEEYQRLAAEKHNEELRLAAELHDIELFEQPPLKEDCPICFLRIPTLDSGWKYNTCCGKVICSGCIHAPVYDNQGNKVDEKTCPFCRIPQPKSTVEADTREKKRMEKDDPIAIYNIGNYHRDGINGFPQDMDKALELWRRAAELGYTRAYCNIGYTYNNGRGVLDEKKAVHYTELAAIRGDGTARYNLGVNEYLADNMDRALKHFMIAVRGGYSDSLQRVKEMYSKGYVTKEGYMKALQLYQEYLGEIKSPQRDKAAAAREDCRYY